MKLPPFLRETHPETLKELRRRLVEIDYRYGHRHLPSSLSALPIIADIYEKMDRAQDVFILSKGHSCAALYAVLERHGYRPDVSKVHPDRDPQNGITITAGSLGHGLPIAVGMAWARKRAHRPGVVHVLMGDGECSEGTTWESLCLARRFYLEEHLRVHIDNNGYQGSDPLLSPFALYGAIHIFPYIVIHPTKIGDGVKMFEENPAESTHTVTDAEFKAIMEELK